MIDRWLKNEKGSAVLLAVLGMAVASVITVTMVFVANTNFKQTMMEEGRTQAFYIAKTGAESLIQHAIDSGDILITLDDLASKSDLGKGTFGDGRFEIEVTKGKNSAGEDIYTVKSTGYVDGVEDWIIAELTPAEAGGGGYEIGDGKIFLNKKDGDNNTQIPFIPQLKGNGMTIYTGKTKYGSKVPIYINDGDASELFRSISDRGNGDVSSLNAQEKRADTGGKYRLEIKEPTTGTISSSNRIKREHLIRTDKTGAEMIELSYGLTKEEVVNYFSKGKLPSNSMTNSEKDNAIQSMFMLPISSTTEYDSYISSSRLFPSVSKPSGVVINNATDLDSLPQEVTSKRQIDLRAYQGVSRSSRLVVKEKGELTIKTAPNTVMYLDSGIEMSQGGKLNIEADGRLDIYVSSHAQPDGDILITGPGKGQVTMHMLGNTPFQTNNKAKIIGMNLYAPNTEVQLQNEIEFEGVIVANHLQFKDTATFRAPSAGTSVSDSNKVKQLKSIEWRR